MTPPLSLQACQVIAKSHAKVNLFLKIVGKTQIHHHSYHLLESRFMRVASLFDVLGFNFNAKAFDVVGDFDCPLEKNTIYRAFKILLSLISKRQAKVLNGLEVIVQKAIPSGGGLGGGSSNAACFLEVVNQALHLGFSTSQLMEIGANIGSDVPFFASGLEIANVGGRGEVVTPCDEAPFLVEIFSPKVHCSTQAVFQKYAEEFYSQARTLQAKNERWLQKSNAEILEQNAFVSNDLLKPLLRLHPSLESYCKKNVFLSGSGSCFWKAKGA